MVPHLSYENRILAIVMIVSFINPFTSSALNLALPDIGLTYKVTESHLGWVIEVFLIASTICIMPIGKLADKFGKRRVFLWGASIFMISSLGVSLISSIYGLIALRVLQGIGSACIFATSFAIITLVYPPERRGKAMGFTVSAVYCGLSLGPVIGGFLNYYCGWKSIFYFIAFFCAVAVLSTIAFMKEEWIADAKGKFDTAGAIAYSIALVLMMFGLSEILNLGYAKYVLLGGMALFALFLCWEKRQTNPIIPIQLFLRNRTFSCSSFAAMLNYSATFAISFLLSMYLQRILGFTSRDAGLVLLLQPILMAVLSPVTGSLSDHVSAALLSSAGMGCIAVGLAFLAYDVPLQSVWVLLACLIIIGIGFSLFTAPNNNAIMESVPKEYVGMASSMIGTVRLVGQVLSVAIVTLVMSRTEEGGEAMLTDNIQLAFIIFTILCIVGILPSMVRSKK